MLLLLRGRGGSGDGRVQRRVQVEGVRYLAEGEVRRGAGHHVRRLTGAAAALRVAGHAKLLQLVLQNVRLLLLVLVARVAVVAVRRVAIHPKLLAHLLLLLLTIVP